MVSGVVVFLTDTEAPAARADTSVTFVQYKGNPTVLLFGGRYPTYPTNLAANDLWQFDCVQWRRIGSTAAAPAPRFLHGSAVMGSQMVIVHGQRKRYKSDKTDFFYNDVWMFSDRWRRAVWHRAGPEGR